METYDSLIWHSLHNFSLLNFPRLHFVALGILLCVSLSGPNFLFIWLGDSVGHKFVLFKDKDSRLCNDASKVKKLETAELLEMFDLSNNCSM